MTNSTKKVSAEKIAAKNQTIASLYQKFDAAQNAGDDASALRLASELVDAAFDPEYEAKK